MVPGTDDEIVIATLGETVELAAGNTTFTRLTIRRPFKLGGGSLTVTSGASTISARLTLVAGASLGALGTNASLLVTGDTSMDGASVIVRGGASVSLSSLRTYDVNDCGTATFSASGEGSVLDLPALTNLVGSITCGHVLLSILASEGGQVRMPQLAATDGLISVASAGAGSLVDLSSWRRNRGSSGGVSLSPTANGTILVPNLTRAPRVSVTLGAASSIALPAVTNLDYGSLIVRDGAQLTLPNLRSYSLVDCGSATFSATGDGSLLELPALTNLVGSTTCGHAQLGILASGGGHVLLPQLATTDGLFSVASAGDGSLVDLSSWRRNLGLSGGVSLSPTANGSILVPNLTRAPRVGVTLGAASSIALPAVTNLDYGSLRVSDGAQLRLPNLRSYSLVDCGSATFSATGDGSLLELPALTNLVGSVTCGHVLLSILASEGGQVLLPQLATTDGLISVDSAGAGSLVDLTSWRRNRGISGGVSLNPSANGTILVPNLTRAPRVSVTLGAASSIALPAVTNLDYGSLIVRDGAQLTLPSLRSYSLVDCGSATFSATGDGSVLDLPALTNLVGSTTCGHAQLGILASGGGHVLIPQLATTDGLLSVASAGDGSLVDLSSWRRNLGLSGGVSLSPTANGSILVPNLTRAPRVGVTLSAASSIALPAVTNLDYGSLRVSDGAQLRLPNLRSYSLVDCGSAAFSASGEGSVLDLPALTNLVGSVTCGHVLLSILASDGGQVLLPQLATTDGLISVTSAGAGSLIDLSSWKRNLGLSGGVSLSPTLSGSILVPNLTRAPRVSVTLGAASSIALPAVTNLDYGSLRVSDGAQLRLPSLQSYHLGDCGSAAFSASGEGSVLDLPVLTSLVGSVTCGHALLSILASEGGQVLLPRLLRLDGLASLRSAGFGSLIDLSLLSGLHDRSVEARDAAVIRSPHLARLERVTLIARNGGQIDTGQVTKALNCTITADAALLVFPSLTDQTGSTFLESNDGRVAFGPAPRILLPPLGGRVPLNAPVRLQVSADGEAPLTYEWRRNGQPIPGATNATFEIPKAQPADAGTYTVVVSNGNGPTESATALLELDLPSLGLTDLFAPRPLYTTATGLGFASNLGASNEPAEPRHAGKRGGASLWMAWRAPQSGVATFGTVGSSFDTLLAVYTGNAVDVLVPIASDEDSGGFLTSELHFNAVAGMEYQVVVDGFAAAGGSILLGWELDPAAPALPEILSQPSGVLAVTNTPVRFSVSAIPHDATFQWLRNGIPLPGQNGSVLQFDSVTGADAGSYVVRIRTPAGSVLDSAEARLELIDRPPTEASLSVDKLEDLFDEDSPEAPAGPILHGRELAGGPAIGIAGSQWTDNSTATASPEDPMICGRFTTASRWFRMTFSPPLGNTQEYEVHTEGSEIPAMLAVFTNRTPLTLLACDTAAPPARPGARVRFVPQRGVEYLVLVDGLDGGRGRIQLNRLVADTDSPVRVFIEQSGANVRIHFQGTLEWAPTPSDPFTAIPGATSPFSLPAGNGALFFRSRL